jgi:hypothetical protein
MNNSFAALTDMTRSIVLPFTETTLRPGTFGMSRIELIIGFKLGETIKEMSTLL